VRIKGRIEILVPVIMILSIMTACSGSSQYVQGERWVIFPERRAQELGIAEWFLEPDQTAAYWTPTEEDVLALENGLAAFLQEDPDRFNSETTPAWERLDNYNRQYIGLILDQKRIVYANFFCDSFETDWRKDFIFVMDGGDCYFQVKYDVESAEFFDLQVNGNA
jgi:hypothetical protein